MATKVLMEALSPTMEEGRLVKWLKNEGDQVKTGDVLAEVETDKAVMELVARGDGVLRKRLASEGDSSAVGTLLGVVAAPDEDISALLNAAGPKPVASDTTTQPVGKPADAGDVIARAKEFEGVTSIPYASPQSQGEASTPPQERERRGGQRIDSSAHTGTRGATASSDRPRSSPLARRLRRSEVWISHPSVAPAPAAASSSAISNRHRRLRRLRTQPEHVRRASAITRTFRSR